MDARDSFSVESACYASDRPTYPPELFTWIASMCRDRRAAWDCATGNGQAAMGLAPWFDRVEATDIFAAQVAEGFALPNVRYSAQPAERTVFSDGSFDLVAVAQALHWFDFDRFWPEVRRVARDGAFFCAWGYAWFERTPELKELHAVYLDPLSQLLDRYWAPNNRILWSGYRSERIGFPFERVEAPPFAIRLSWEVERLIGYVRTWSAWKAASADPSATDDLAILEREARHRFAGRGPIPLILPIVVAAAAIS